MKGLPARSSFFSACCSAGPAASTLVGEPPSNQLAVSHHAMTPLPNNKETQSNLPLADLASWLITTLLLRFGTLEISSLGSIQMSFASTHVRRQYRWDIAQTTLDRRRV